MITSLNNDRVKLVKSLKLRKYREEEGLFYIEGHKFVLEGINSLKSVSLLLISESYMKSQAYDELIRLSSSIDIDLGQNLLKVTDHVFSKISDTKTPQGIIGVFPLPVINEKKLEDMRKIILLENLQDPGNLGTIIRTAHAAAFDAIAYGRGTVDAYNPKILRSSAGSIFHIDILAYDMETIGLASLLKEKGFCLYGTHLKGTAKSFDLDFAKKSVIVIGNEAKGMTDELASFCDYLTYIPMPGKAESLNASVAAGLMIYELLRKERDL